MMAKTIIAEMARSGSALTTRWRMLASNPEELHMQQGELTWPAASIPPPETGK